MFISFKHLRNCGWHVELAGDTGVFIEGTMPMPAFAALRDALVEHGLDELQADDVVDVAANRAEVAFLTRDLRNSPHLNTVDSSEIQEARRRGIEPAFNGKPSKVKT